MQKFTYKYIYKTLHTNKPKVLVPPKPGSLKRKYFVVGGWSKIHGHDLMMMKKTLMIKLNCQFNCNFIKFYVRD